LPAVVTVVAQALPARYAAVYLKRVDADELILAAEHGTATGESSLPPSPLAAVGTAGDNPGTDPSHSLTFPVLYKSEEVGLLLVVPADDLPPTPEERHLLAAIARGAGSAAQVVRQEHDLQLARERLVLAREEERRRLRRNLHDSIGPTLAALSLRAGSVRNLIEQDPPAAQEQFNELREQIHSVITDIRRVVYNLRPPALDELGMLPAIQEQARQFSTGGLQVSVDAPDQMPPLPAAVEVAAYRIVTEALANVARHAHARLCSIHLSVNDQVSIEVVDDGVGLLPNHRAGVGIASMRERVAELGGSCTIESPAEGGTRVLAFLPASSRAPGWETTSSETALLVDDSG
jgi:signal transduction histidine kinase